MPEKGQCIPYAPESNGSDAKRFELLSKKELAPDTYELTFRAPLIARSRKPGQFVILKANETGERIPLTIADSDAEAGTITLDRLKVERFKRLMSELGHGADPHVMSRSYIQHLCGEAPLLPGAQAVVEDLAADLMIDIEVLDDPALMTDGGAEETHAGFGWDRVGHH